MNLIKLKQEQKKAVLVFTDIYSQVKNSLIHTNVKNLTALQSIEESELKSLSETILVNPVFSLRFKIGSPNPSTLVGSGQLEKILNVAEEKNADLIIFNCDLSPRIQRNLEEVSGLCVIDRREVIIQIFADRAQTREAVLQARLAQLEYSMPRLTRKWTGLSQQRGGVKGSRGAGEKKLELDKRRLRTEISKLRKEVEKVRVQRNVQRKSRTEGNKKIGAIVGYTNAGKSSLLKKLSGTDIFAENKLFATLDSETRKIFFPNKTGGVQFLLTDTVGFVSNLPHQLIDAFHSTLEEAALADFLIILCDASHPAMCECLAVTQSVLEELNCGKKNAIIVINKIDCVFDPASLLQLKTRYPEAVEISLKTGEGLDFLKIKLEEIVNTVL
ncbi:GTPase HflX [Treponema pedis]|uniref:GTPase HflX n=1 Tax=Treponema pedis TaxID=409322 RepID=UPI00040F8157